MWKKFTASIGFHPTVNRILESSQPSVERENLRVGWVKKVRLRQMSTVWIIINLKRRNDDVKLHQQWLTVFCPSLTLYENNNFDISARVVLAQKRAFYRLLRTVGRDILANTPCLFVQEEQRVKLAWIKWHKCCDLQRFIRSISNSHTSYDSKLFNGVNCEAIKINNHPAASAVCYDWKWDLMWTTIINEIVSYQFYDIGIFFLFPKCLHKNVYRFFVKLLFRAF